MTPSDAERDRQRQISDLAKQIASDSFLMDAIARWTEQVVTAAVEVEREKQRQRISDLIRDGLGEIGKREAVEERLREARDVVAALLLTHDAGGVTMSAAKEARAWLAKTEKTDAE